MSPKLEKILSAALPCVLIAVVVGGLLYVKMRPRGAHGSGSVAVAIPPGTPDLIDFLDAGAAGKAGPYKARIVEFFGDVGSEGMGAVFAPVEPTSSEGRLRRTGCEMYRNREVTMAGIITWKALGLSPEPGQPIDVKKCRLPWLIEGMGPKPTSPPDVPACFPRVVPITLEPVPFSRPLITALAAAK